MSSIRTNCSTIDRSPISQSLRERTGETPLNSMNRRLWLAAAAAGISAFGLHSNRFSVAGPPAVPGAFLRPKFGLVTYLWGKDMDLGTVIEACEFANMAGVELRTEHKHGVEPSLSAQARQEVRKKFESSGIELIGYGSNCEFHSKEPEALAANIEKCKEYIHLMHDCGGSGVKVKPNAFVPNVPEEKTIEQIGKALNLLAAYGEKYGQQIRLEVHGSRTSQLHVIRDIFKVADHKNAVVCWNCNSEDLQEPGLAANFEMVRERLGATTHVRELDSTDYPYQELFNLLVRAKYDGWILLEARTDPAEKFAAMNEQNNLFNKLLDKAIEHNNRDANSSTSDSTKRSK